MPKRTNSFQQLIYLIHEQLHERADVVESKMLTDRVTGLEQEVDVVIEESTGEYSFMLGVECVDYKRPATIEWVQRMRAKHEHRTDKLILVSASGFTPNARLEAERYNIPTMSLTEAIAADWTVVVNKLKVVYLGRFTYTIVECRVVLAEECQQTEDPQIDPVMMLYGADDQHIGTVGTIIEYTLRHPKVGPNLMKRFYDDESLSRVTLEFAVPSGSYLIDTSGTKRLASALRATATCTRTMIPIEMTSGAYGTTPVAWGQTISGDERLYLVTTEREGEPSRSRLRISSTDGAGPQVVKMIVPDNDPSAELPTAIELTLPRL